MLKEINKVILSEKEKCVGCGGCVIACPSNCISMHKGDSGFFYPDIDQTDCLTCGKCTEVCPVNSGTLVTLDYDQEAYLAWSKNDDIRYKSSSGGVFFELAQKIVEKGGVVYGAAFGEDYSVYHKRIDKVENLYRIMGSKYVQSETVDAFRDIMRDLNNGKLVLFSGTPCQVKAIKKLCSGYDSLFTVSIICHGVPSPSVWREYLNHKMEQYSAQRIRNVSFRDKTYNWNMFCMKIDFDDNTYIENHKNDLYMQGFLSNLYLREACYACEAKGDNDVSDITLGDFWGIEKIKPELDIKKGCSCVIVKSSKGEELFELIKNFIYYETTDYSIIATYNIAIEKSVPKNNFRDRFFSEFRTGFNEDVIRKNLDPLKTSDAGKINNYYKIIYDYFLNELRGKHLYEELKKRKIRNVVLYAITDLLQVVRVDLKRYPDINVALADKKADSYKKTYADYEVYGIDDLIRKCQEKSVDAILICNPFREKQIIDELINKEIDKAMVYSLVTFIQYSA